MENYRKWVELPRDVTVMILKKVPQIEILESVQFVCKPWYDVCKEPSMWRSIRFKDLEEHPQQVYLEEQKRVIVGETETKMVFDHRKMVFHAVDRSAGGLIHLDIQGFLPYALCSYVASRSTQLKRLRFAECYNISYKDLIEALGKLTSLDEIDFTLCSFVDFFRPEIIIAIINSCPSSLTTFKLNGRGSENPFRSDNKVALAIAGRLPELHHLQLIGNTMTNVGLTAILNGCPRLQSLDLRACFHLDLEQDLGKRLSKQLIHLRCPYDSTDDYNYPTEEYDYESDDPISSRDVDFGDYYDD